MPILPQGDRAVRRQADSRGENGLTADNALGSNGLTSPGKVFETRSYLRWEEPTLGINGEGRVSPLMPGCQVITTVIDKDGNTVVHNEIWTAPDGKKGLDHAAVQPHTAAAWRALARAATTIRRHSATASRTAAS